MTSTAVESNLTRLLKTWPPSNPEVIQRIRRNLDSGAYKTNRQQLLEDLKSDVSLFLYCLRELALRTGKPEKDQSFNEPTKLFLESDLSIFRELLYVDPSQISKYSLEEAKSFQASQLLGTVTSASVAASLSSANNIDPDNTYVCGLLRQLGLTLVAWSYPTIYRKALEGLRPDQSLDDELSEMLGFSPSLLGIKIARSWHLTPTLMVGMGDSAEEYCVGSEEDQKRDQVVGETLARVCELGELFAAGLDPDRDKVAEPSPWHEAVKRIEKFLGEEGYKKLQARIETLSAAYIAFAPKIFQWSIASPERAERPEVPVERLFDDNVYIKHCPRVVQESLNTLYEKLKSSQEISSHIKEIMDSLMPICGFPRGCIYLIDPQSRKLAPRLTFGDLVKSEIKPISYIGGDQDPLALAFRANAPVTAEHEAVFGGSKQKVQYIAGVLGETQRAGLLYVHIDDNVASLRSKSPITYYKALRQALADCLGIR
jgi:HDOD domain